LILSGLTYYLLHFEEFLEKMTFGGMRVGEYYKFIASKEEKAM